MPGKLVVAVRGAAIASWTIAGVSLDAAAAGALVPALLAANPGGRVVVLQVIRSFAATVVSAEDAIPVIDP